MKVNWTRGALQSLSCIRDYIASDNEIASATVARRIKNAVKQLEIFPHAGRLGLRSGTRELVVAGLPYVVVYRVENATTQILRVLHTSQQWH